MINLREIEEAIHQLETSSSTYNNCMKLASLYIIRDEFRKKEGQSGYYTYGYYPYYERGGQSGNSGQGGSSSYGYKPMMYDDDSLMIKRDMMEYPKR